MIHDELKHPIISKDEKFFSTVSSSTTHEQKFLMIIEMSHARFFSCLPFLCNYKST